MSSARSSRMSLNLKRKSRIVNDMNDSKLTVQFISDESVRKVVDLHSEDLMKVKKKSDKAIGRPTPESNRKLRKRRLTNVGVDTIEEETIILEESECDINDKCEKPRDLFEEDDVEGGKMCSFRTPSKRQGMLQKARESASKYSGTPKGKRTPTKTATPLRPLRGLTPKRGHTPSKQTPKKYVITQPKNVDIAVSKTPYNLRQKAKKAIKVYIKQVECEESDEDYDDGSDSDYEGSASEEEEDDASVEEASDSDSGKGSEGAGRSCRRSLRFHPSATPSTKGRSKDLNYVFTADEYFESRAAKRPTSDRVLSRLRTPRLDSSDVTRLLDKSSVPPTHVSALARRRECDAAMFDRWMIALSQGFSILAYGLGSKYKILQNFHRKMLPQSHVLVVNGFFPSLSIKEIVDSIATDLLGLSHPLPSPHAVVDWIEGRRWMPRVFLIVHNMDAEPLRCDKTQQLLARLACLPRVHLVASVDHINCPLLWDQAKLSAFNFMWQDTTSFLPYAEETSYETSLMVHNAGSLALSSLLNVYRSLTQNSRGVFRIILRKHLDENSPKYNGMAFSELYSRCREEMLVTSDLALRTMLTEFLDHQMVKWRKDNEHLYIPTDVGVLRQFSSLTQND